jgi:transcriptional regulator with XRE-family HTH domain
MNCCERIRQLFEDNNVTPYEVSVKTCISQSTLSRILNNKTVKLSIRTTDLLANYFNVNRVWLIFGNGDKMQANDDSAGTSGKEAGFKRAKRVDSQPQIEQLKALVKELKKKNYDLVEELKMVKRANDNLSESIKDCTRESLIKTELIRSLSKSIEFNKDLPIVG